MQKLRLFSFISLALIGLMWVPGLISGTLAQTPETFLPPHADRVEDGLRDRVQHDGQGTYWVYLTEQADLSAAYGIQDWNARGEYVYQTLLTTARESQADILSFLEAEKLKGNVDSYRSYFIVNAVLVTSNVQIFDALAARDNVAWLRGARTFAVPELTPMEELEQLQAIEWGVSRIRSPEIWSTYGTTGEGVVVANIDTGVAYTHAALVNQYRGNLGGSFDHNFNWYDPTGLCSGSAPCDQNNHGTHTMGTMVGYDGGSNQIGNAPGAKWIAARGCETNFCSDASLTASWEWMIAPCALGDDPGDPSCDPSKRPNVLNYSIGGPGGDPSDIPLINAARAAGIVLSISAGNSGPGSNTVGSPGDYCNVIGVGATDINDVIASFSSRGPGNFDCGDPEMRKPDVSAPGVNVRSSIANGGYSNFNGTSMAAPHVSGCAALLLGIDINTTHDQIFDALTNTAVDLGPAGFDFSYGYGRIDCFEAAVYLFQATPTPGPTPTPTNTPEPGANQLHVASIEMSVVAEGGNRFHAEALVTIHDENNQPAAGAVVTGSFTGDSSNTASGTTDANGQVTLASTRAKFGADWTFCVDNVVKSGFSYNPAANVETCDSTGSSPTPTPTPLPPTPTPTPTPGTGSQLHVGDLDGVSFTAGSSWTAQVTVTVHDAAESPVAGAVVSGSWSNGTSGSGSCTTDANGQCTLTRTNIRNSSASATFTVSGVSKSGFSYNPAANHDPDGDSDGTSIVIPKP